MNRILAVTVAAAGLVAGSAAAQEIVRVPERASTSDAREKQAHAKLDTMNVSLDFEDAPLKDVLKYLRQVSGLNIVLDPEVAQEANEQRVTLQVTDVSLRSAFSLVLEFVNLGMRWKNGVFLVAKGEKLKGEMILRLYDVRDLSMKIQDFPGPRIELKSSSDAAGDSGVIFADQESASPPPTTDEIVETIKTMTGGGAWEGGASVTVIGGLLLVKQTPEVHAEILKLIALLRATR
ncbi:MAG: hypothetical protein L0216_18250 [Planctomycetales bacterium]|nr:hypothetical protein [Planctomycetales bacterium]